jgi:hypothetical protein
LSVLLLIQFFRVPDQDHAEAPVFIYLAARVIGFNWLLSKVILTRAASRLGFGTGIAFGFKLAFKQKDAFSLPEESWLGKTGLAFR